MKITVFHVGSSLAEPLARAEREINARYALDLRIAAFNCGAPLDDDQWSIAATALAASELVFIIHVTDAENADRIVDGLKHSRSHAVIPINCMPPLMRLMRMGSLEFASRSNKNEPESKNFIRRAGSWMADSMKSRGKSGQFMSLLNRAPAVLRLLPSRGRLGDAKNYLTLFCYFLQPTPSNIEMMLLYAIKHYVPDQRQVLECRPPESMPSIAIYHPDAEVMFDSFDKYRKWYERAKGMRLDPSRTIGLLLMRPQVISGSRRHYDGVIRAIEGRGLAVIPALATFMDNRAACSRFFIDGSAPRVSQVVSLTGFSFVGGPASHDSEAAVRFLRDLNVPFHSAVSLDVQSIESWSASALGLNPVQTGMQVAIPEIDGATEPMIFGGVTSRGGSLEPIEERCERLAARIARWNRLRVASRSDLRLAFLLFCFPPNKGNVGTAAELDVFPSLWATLGRLKDEGYRLDVPESVDALRELVLEGNSGTFGTAANVAARLPVDDYRHLCPWVNDIEAEWGTAPGRINSFGGEILICGIQLGNVFVGIQPTFGYEGDPMRLLASRSGSPHHGFMGLYTYVEKVFKADAVVHVGTHGALEFMPGKQVGLSASCWPDRLVGTLPHIYLYSVNNPSEGTIAKRRSYAELVSYLTPPVQSAGLYRDLAELKELLTAYRQESREIERERLYGAIEELASRANLYRN
jgi:magnesium chelatase subunit H